MNNTHSARASAPCQSKRRPGGPPGLSLLKAMEHLQDLGEADMNEMYPHMSAISTSPSVVGNILKRATRYGLAERTQGWPARFRPLPNWRETLQARMAAPMKAPSVNSVWALGGLAA